MERRLYGPFGHMYMRQCTYNVIQSNAKVDRSEKRRFYYLYIYRRAEALVETNHTRVLVEFQYYTRKRTMYVEGGGGGGEGGRTDG